MFSKIHGHYQAHKITLAGVDEDAFARSLTSARVQMNPHQVEAALFALKSPLSKGVLLADEVGLGKTIEAGLVLSQRWAEHKRRMILIVPASLRKQWQQELYEKFSLRAEIIESATYNLMRKAGHARPFDATKGIVICSYEFAARKADELRSIKWDLGLAIGLGEAREAIADQIEDFLLRKVIGIAHHLKGFLQFGACSGGEKASLMEAQWAKRPADFRAAHQLDQILWNTHTDVRHAAATHQEWCSQRTHGVGPLNKLKVGE